MIRWREQHGPGGEHWWECTVWCSPHDQVEGATWAWGRTLFCWGNVLEVTPSNPLPNPQSPPPTPIYKFEDLVAKQHNLYNKWKWFMYKCINYDLFQLLYLVVALYPGSWLIKSLGTRLLLLGTGNTFLMSDQLWHSTPFPHSTPVITRELYIPRDEGNTLKMKLHTMKPRHHSLSSSSTDKATCFVPPDSERASPPAIEQCTS